MTDHILRLLQLDVHGCAITCCSVILIHLAPLSNGTSRSSTGFVDRDYYSLSTLPSAFTDRTLLGLRVGRDN